MGLLVKGIRNENFNSDGFVFEKKRNDLWFVDEVMVLCTLYFLRPDLLSRSYSRSRR